MSYEMPISTTTTKSVRAQTCTKIYQRGAKAKISEKNLSELPILLSFNSKMRIKYRYYKNRY